MTANGTKPTSACGDEHTLYAALDPLAQRLEEFARTKTTMAVPSESLLANGSIPAGLSMQRLGDLFDLSSFEKAVVLLCAGAQLYKNYPANCAIADGATGHACPTFSLAFKMFSDADWRALSPTAPLRYWRLIELQRPGPLVSVPLQIDERILNYLMGVEHMDERLMGLLERVTDEVALPPSQEALCGYAARISQRKAPTPPVIQLCGEDLDAKRAIAAVSARRIGLDLLRIAMRDVPNAAAERAALARLTDRELILTSAALLVYHDAPLAKEDDSRHVAAFIEPLKGLVFVASREPLPLERRTRIRLDVEPPTPGERRDMWLAALGEAASIVDADLDRLSAQFRLDTAGICAARQSALFDASIEGSVRRRLWEACRKQARRRLDGLAERIKTEVAWDDLVLPADLKGSLRELMAHVRHGQMVHERWGFASKGRRGLGVAALFAGASGTGKTLAAEVIANELRLDLYRIDLSQVVSKYIGETEKNLARIFEAAEESGAVLLFDEADALFGKRSEVKDSHDRYANIEVSYLLQKMEAYRGLAVLTTNMKSALDGAFLRRLRFVLQFPFPDARLREEIWRRAFPRETPTEALELKRLARLTVTGGNIRNIALHAAFLAAEEGTSVRMPHVLKAARNEYAKLERPMTQAEFGGQS